MNNPPDDETPEEKARRIGVPLIPKLPVVPGPNPTVAVCGECGLELRQTMMYVCPRGGACPTGLGGVTIC